MQASKQGGVAASPETLETKKEGGETETSNSKKVN
jgi:hypothetical protein